MKRIEKKILHNVIDEIAIEYELTNKEKELIFELCMRGCTNYEAAKKLMISSSTVQNRLSTILSKMDKNNVREILALVIRILLEKLKKQRYKID
ncbi:helix-turn-helix transcriptional regulator [Bacillus sp. SCS-151]|uniref:helix-turn-helix transcriptional regulator n=1 Tax=Nanhaiella sioensis TaxID=3115293 RepID=UPI00397DD2DC